MENKEDIYKNMGNLSVYEMGELMFEIDKHNYQHKPVDIETFIYDDYFLGQTIGKSIFPIWVDVLKSIYPSPFMSVFNEVIISACIGAGKTTVSNVGMLYDLYRVLCLKNPQTYFSLMNGTRIVFMIFSTSKLLASGVNFEYLEEFIGLSPYFSKIALMPKGKKSVYDKGIEFPKNVAIEIGSQVRHSLGKAVFGAVIDEANFHSDNTNQAEEIYNGILRRIESRFFSNYHVLNGTLFVVSSPKSQNSFLEERIKKANNIKTSFILENIPIWEVKKHINNYCGEYFYVHLGNENEDPHIIEDENEDNIDLTNQEILPVPIEYKDSFIKDLLKSINDVAGRKIGNSFLFIKQKSKIKEAMKLTNICNKSLIELSNSRIDDNIINYFDMSYFDNLPHPEAYRYVHIDLSKNIDRTGISSCYALPLPNHERLYTVEWIVALEGKNEEIPFEKIVDFLYYLKVFKKVPIKLVSSDSYQGDYLRQRLSIKQLEAEYLSLSIKKNKSMRGFFLTFRDYLLSGKLLLPNHELCLLELSELIEQDSEIVHPVNFKSGGVGHDDIAQSVIGSFINCFKSPIITSINMNMQFDNSNKKSIKNLFYAVDNSKNLNNKRSFLNKIDKLFGF